MKEPTTNNLKEQLADYIEQYVGIKIVELSKVAQGVSTDVFRLNPTFENLYVRILPDEGYSYFPVVAAHNEALKIGVSVPEVHHYEDCSEHLSGKSIMILSAMKGIQLNSNSKINQRVLLELGRQVAKFNTLEAQGHGWIQRTCSKVIKQKPFAGVFNSVYEDLTDKLESRISAFADQRLLNKDQIDKIYKLTEELKLLSVKEKPVLSHTDISREHVFVDSGEYAGLIDFDDLRGSNKFMDLAELSKGFTIKEFEDILTGYREVTSIDNDEMNYEFKLTRIFWFIEKGYWVKDMSDDPQDNKYYQVLIEDLKDL